MHIFALIMQVLHLLTNKSSALCVRITSACIEFKELPISLLLLERRSRKIQSYKAALRTLESWEITAGQQWP